MQPIHRHDLFRTLQSFPKLLETQTLIEIAGRAGYQTVSVFPDQLTCWVGTQAGSDDDRSGPVGWRQPATSYVENVSFLTLGLPARNPEAPISLLDTGSLLGLAPDLPASNPVVELTLSEPSEWPILLKGARLRWDGSVELDEKLLEAVFRRLRSYRPWPPQKSPRIYPLFNKAEMRPWLTMSVSMDSS